LLFSVAAIVIAVCCLASPRTIPVRSPHDFGRATLHSPIHRYAHRHWPGGSALESSADDDEDDDGIADDDDAQLDVAPCPSTSAIIHDVVDTVSVVQTFRSSSGHKHGTASRAPPLRDRA